MLSARMCTLVGSIFISAFVHCVVGFCFESALQQETTDANRVRNVCVLGDLASSSQSPPIKLLPGSTIFTADSCLECTCTMGGLRCCGFGRNAGVVGLPSDCREVQDGCHALYVKKDNSSLDCMTGEPIDPSAPKFSPHPDDAVHMKTNINVNLNQLTSRSATSVPPSVQHFPSFLPGLRSPWDFRRPVWSSANDVTMTREIPLNEILASLMKDPQPNTVRRVSFKSSSGMQEPQFTSQVIPITAHQGVNDAAHDMVLPWMFFN